MTTTQLKEKLSKYGTVLVAKEGAVFTVFIKGNGLSQSTKLMKIGAIIHEYAGEKYPDIEVFLNEDDFILSVLKPKQ